MQPLALPVEILTKLGLEIEVETSEKDGVTIVYIDTPGLEEDEDGPILRIYLNDEPVYQNPPYPTDTD